MLELWLSKGIYLAFDPLSEPGGELAENPDTRNGIISNLAVELSPDFDNGKTVVSQALIIRANKQFSDIKRIYRRIDISNKIVSNTLPVGAGHSRYRWSLDRTFFPSGSQLDN